MGSAEPMGSVGGETEAKPPRSALADIAEQTVLYAGPPATPATDASPAPEPPPDPDTFATAEPAAVVIATTTDPTTEPVTTVAPESAAAQQPAGTQTLLSPEQAARLRAHQGVFRARLGEFRRRRVLVPYGENGAALTVEVHGARWLLVFTHEAALARYARARGESDRAWRYRAVWGAAVLDAGVPAVAEAGLPCGVLVDAGDGERGLVLPPVVGIVPEAVAVNRPDTDGEGTDSGTGQRTTGVPGVDSRAATGRPTGEGR